MTIWAQANIEFVFGVGNERVRITLIQSPSENIIDAATAIAIGEKENLPRTTLGPPKTE